MEPLHRLLDLGAVGRPKPVDAPIAVLVVEADGEAQGELREALEAAGLRVQILGGGADLLGAARAGSFDAVVLAFDLPGEDGMQLVKRLRRGGIWVPVIFTSRASGEEVAVRAYESGAWDYVAKGPGFAAEVATKVRQWVVRYRTTAGLQAQLERLGASAPPGAARELTATLAQGVGEPLLRILGAAQELLRRLQDPAALQLVRDIEGWARTARAELEDLEATGAGRRAGRRGVGP